jgi:hypothetical protein
VDQRIPKIGKHLIKLNGDTQTFAVSWFLRLYVDVFPLETTLRIWDLLFSEGYKILFRVALSFLKLNESKILSMDELGGVIHLLSEQSMLQYDEWSLIKVMNEFVNFL